MAEFDLLGILEGTPGRLPQGVQGITRDGLTAVLSAEARPLIRLPQGRRAQLAGLAERLRLQEACLALGTFLPAGPRAHLSPARAALFLDANRPFLFERIARYSGLVQYQLQIAWDESRVLERFRQAPEIAPLFQAPFQAEAIPQAIMRLSAALGEVILDHLSAALEVKTLPRIPGLLWNGALLVPRASDADLDLALARIDAIWTEGLTLRLTGPAPVVSFCTIELQEITEAHVDWALDRFGLATLSEVGEVATLRRRLMISGSEAHEEIDFQARVIEAAARLGRAQGFALAATRADGDAAVSLQPSEVA